MTFTLHSIMPLFNFHFFNFFIKNSYKTRGDATVRMSVGLAIALPTAALFTHSDEQKERQSGALNF